jgi:hypothetical protein
MSEHRIRLRGGWECHYREGDDGDGPEIVQRISLPFEWPANLPAKVRLIRQFGKPPVDSRVDEVSLELRNVPGIEKTWVNGQESVGRSDVPDSRSIPLEDPLLPRNGLAIDVDLAMARTVTGEWGEIWLSIHPRGG